MKSGEVRSLTTDLHVCLEAGSTIQAPEVLAAAYARECREVNNRLTRIAEMLAAGGELQALQVAEAAPPLLDRATELSFGSEVEWQKYCQQHGHEVAPMIDVETLQELEGLYSQGLSSGHPLYKDYRAASLSRDDDRAYDLARLIVRMNPDDTNAQRELVRLERKKVRGLLKSLQEALEAGQDEELVELLAKLEEAAPDDLKGEPCYGQAAERRWRLRLAQVQQEIPTLLNRVEAILGDGNMDWRDAAVIQSQFAAMLGEFGIKLPEADAARYQGAERKLEELRKEAARKARVAELAEELEAITEEVQIRTVTPLGLDPKFAAGALEGILRLERDLTKLRGELSSSDEARLSASRGQLEQVLERRRRRRRMLLINCTVVAIAVLALATVFGWFSMRASERRNLLAELRENGQSAAATKLVQSIRDGEELLLRFPGLSAELATTEQWLSSARRIEENVESQLEKLEDFAARGFAGEEPTSLFERLVETGELVQKLPSALAGAADARLDIIRNDADRYLLSNQGDSDRNALEILGNIDEQLDAVDYAGPATGVKESAQAWLDLIEPFLAMSGRSVPILKLPSATESRMNDIETRLKKLLALAEDTLSALEEVESALAVEAYEDSLTRLAKTSFREAAMAQQVIDHFPSQRSQRAFLLFRGDLFALKWTENMPAVKFPKPASAAQIDRDTINELLSDPFLSGLWEVAWEGRGKTYLRLLSRGKLIKDKETWSGMVAEYPTHIGIEPEFKERKFTVSLSETVMKNNPTSTSKMMESLQLDNLLDPTGTEFQESVVPLIDRVFNNRTASSLAKAYVLNQLFRIVKGREIDWGLHLIPELKDDLDEVTKLYSKIPMRSSYWLHAEKPNGADQWQAFFQQRKARDYFGTLRTVQETVRAALKQPIALAGMVDADGTAVFQPSREQKVVWGLCANKDGSTEMRVFGAILPNGEAIPLPRQTLPLSPLFSLEVPVDAHRDFLLGLHQLPGGGEGQ